MRKIIMLLLSFSLFATNIYGETMTFNSKESFEFQDVLVDDFECLDEFALKVINTNIAIDESGLFYMTNQKSLEENLSKEQFDVVLKQLEARNNYTQTYGVTASGPIGSAGNPYQLTLGSYYPTTTNNYAWFQGSVSGAIDFTVSSSNSANYNVYKKTLFGLTELQRGNVNGGQETISNTNLNNQNTIQIRIVLNSNVNSNVSCMLRQHSDSKNISFNGNNQAIWKPSASSAIANTNILWKEYWYAPKDQVFRIFDYVFDSNFYSNQANLLNGTMTAASIATATNTPVSIVVAILGLIGSVGNITNFKNQVLNDIRTCGGYSTATGNYSYGVVFKTYTYNGITFYEVARWNSYYAYGAPGWTGAW